MSITAMKLALDALESCTPADISTGHVVWPSYDEQAVAQAITALRTAIEQAETQEPVAFYWEPSDDVVLAKHWTADKPPEGWTPLYTTPAADDLIATYEKGFNDCAAQRKPQYNKTEMNCFVQNLYDQKMREGKHGHYETMFHVVHRAIEAAHGIGEKK